MALSERIPLKGTINTRDLGGYRGKEGKAIVFKRLLRTDSLHALTREDVSFLVSRYLPRWVIDFRGLQEAKGAPDVPIPGCSYLRLPFRPDDQISLPERHASYGLSHGHMNHLIDYIYSMDPKGTVDGAMEESNRAYLASPKAIESLRKMLQIAKDNKEGAVLLHCADGKDRTGFAVALLLSILGVSREDILRDYLKTNEYTHEKAVRRREMLLKEGLKDEAMLQNLVDIAGVKERWLKAGLEELDKNYGGPLGYAETVLTLSKEDAEEIRENYLV